MLHNKSGELLSQCIIGPMHVFYVGRTRHDPRRSRKSSCGSGRPAKHSRCHVCVSVGIENTIPLDLTSDGTAMLVTLLCSGDKAFQYPAVSTVCEQ